MSDIWSAVSAALYRNRDELGLTEPLDGIGEVATFGTTGPNRRLRGAVRIHWRLALSGDQMLITHRDGVYRQGGDVAYTVPGDKAAVLGSVTVTSDVKASADEVLRRVRSYLQHRKALNT